MWKASIQEELESIYENNVWEPVPKPKECKPIGCRYVFKKKFDENGNVARYKTRLVAKGYAQRYGLDFEETYAPVAKFKSIRTIVAIASLDRLKLHQMDAYRSSVGSLMYIQVRYHYIREQIKSGEFLLKYCPTKSQLADLFTKGLSGPLLRDLLSHWSPHNSISGRLSKFG
jgi:hypothetical protein